MKKVLILYAKYGGGHLSAANAITNYIKEKYSNSSNNSSENLDKNVEVQSLDCVEFVSPFLSNLTTNGYKLLTRDMPSIWAKIYSNSKRGWLFNVSTLAKKFMAKRLLKYFDNYKPDLVISVHPFASQVTAYLKETGKLHCELATVFTDFEIHTQWLIGKEYNDYFFISNEVMKEHLIKNEGINENKIYLTGVPLSNRFLDNFDHAKIYNEHNLNPNLKTILFFGGGEFGLGKNKTVRILNALSKYLDEYQVIAISGKNKKMYNAFKNTAAQINNKNIHVYEYTNQVPEFMSISSLVITKPGGLTSSESLASKLPLLIINPIPGQEEENAEFLTNSGAGVWLKNVDEVEEVFRKLLLDEKVLQEMKNNATNISHINSTRDICSTLLN